MDVSNKQMKSLSKEKNLLSEIYFVRTPHYRETAILGNYKRMLHPIMFKKF